MRVAVCVAAHERPARLRALLDALAGQERPPDEVVVCCDDPGSAAVLHEHPSAPLAIVVPPGTGPGPKRNRAWRAASADVCAFTDDDCRPAPGWVARVAAAADGATAVVQGRTVPDPREAGLLRERLARSVLVEPPDAWGQTANIAYPRALLEAVGGFDEAFPAAAAGEDGDLLHRALAAGGRLVAAPDAVVHHAVDVLTPRQAVREAWRWDGLALAVGRHRGLRRRLVLRLFWKPSHAWLALALLTRRPPALAAWALVHRDRYGPSWRGRLRAVTDLPLRLALDLTEMAACARGAVRHRTPLL